MAKSSKNKVGLKKPTSSPGKKPEPAKAQSQPKKAKASARKGVDPSERLTLIQIRAYEKWLSATMGSEVSDDQTRAFWLEAECEIDSEV